MKITVTAAHIKSYFLHKVLLGNGSQKNGDSSALVLTSVMVGYLFTTNSTGTPGPHSHHCLFTRLLTVTGPQQLRTANQSQGYITTRPCHRSGG
jgi:hypothetical protein